MSNGSEWDFMNEKNHSSLYPESRTTMHYIFGIVCFSLLLPTLLIAMGEFWDVIDFFEYGGDVWDVLTWFLYTATIFSILLISGLYFTGHITSDSGKFRSGTFIIVISIINLISRLFDIHEQRINWGFYPSDILEFLYWPSTHERLELVFLGIIIGFLIIKK